MTPQQMVEMAAQRRGRMAQLRQSLTMQQSQNLRALARANPSLSPGVLYAMGTAGVRPDSPAFRVASESQLAQQRATGGWGGDGGEGRGGGGLFSGFGDILPIKIANEGIKAARKAVGFTYGKVKIAGGAVLPDQVGDSVNIAQGAIKGFSRGADIGGSAPGQLLTGWFNSGRGNNGDLGLDDLVSRDVWHQAAMQTDLRQAHEHIKERGGYAGLLTGDTEVDYGNGFFAGGEVGRRAGAAKQASTSERLGGKLPTIGRYLANEVGLEPGGTAYNTISGLVDATVMLGTDPTSYVGGGAARSAARHSFTGEASRDFDADAAAKGVEDRLADLQRAREGVGDTSELTREQLLARAGVIDGVRKTVASDRALEWLVDTNQGRTVTEYLAKETSFYKAWQATKGKVPAKVLLDLTQREMTSDEVIARLGPELGIQVGQKFGIDAVGKVEQGLTSNLGTLATAKFRQKTRDVRAFGAVPERVLRRDDLETTLRTADDFMRSALIKDDDSVTRHGRTVTRETIMRRLAEVDGEEGFLEVAEDMMELGTVKAMTSFGVDQAKARDLFRLYAERQSSDRKFWQDRIVANGEERWGNRAFGRPEDIAVARPDGSFEIRALPHLAAQFLDNNVPLPDAREIRREMSRFRGILSNPAVKMTETSLNYIQEQIFKPLVLLRPAFTIRNQIDEQFRPAGYGLKSLFNHPVQYVSWLMSDSDGMYRALAAASGGRLQARGGQDLLGEEFNSFAKETREARQQLDSAQVLFNARRERWQNLQRANAGADEVLAARKEMEAARNATEDAGRLYESKRRAVQSVTPFTDEAGQYARAVTGGAGNWRNHSFATVNGNDLFEIADPGYSRALGEGLHLLYNDPLVRRLAQGKLTVDEVKQEFWEGGLTGHRTSLAKRDDRMSYVNERVGSDQYVDRTIEFMQQFVGDSPVLRDVVKTGRINGVPLTNGDSLEINSRALEMLEQLKQVEGFLGPQKVIGGRVIKGGEDESTWNRVVNEMFYRLADQPTRVLARSPAFRQSYYKRVEELIGFMDPAEAQKVLKGAQAANLKSQDIARMRRNIGTGNGKLTAAEADLVAKGDALHATNEMFYSLHRRNQFLDAARLIFPFGEAFKNSAAKYADIVAKNPEYPYRLQQLIEGGRNADLNGDGQGFFYTDEQTGEEMFGFPGSRWLMEQLGQDAVGQLRAPVGNLNILGTSVIPGFGPAVQIPAHYVLPDTEDMNAIRELISPYGDRTIEGGALESFAPAWFQKFMAGTAANDTFNLATPAQQRAFVQSQKDWMGYLASTGDYNLQDPSGGEQARLVQDAKKKARSTWFIRGMAQAFAPSPPSPEFLAYDKDGRLHTQFKLAEEYDKIRKEIEASGSGESADRVFIERFGEWAVLATIPNTKPGEDKSPIPPNREALEFYQRHKDAAERHPEVFGLFAPDPADADFDFVSYNRQLRSGERVVVSPQEAIERTNQRVARMIVKQAEDIVGPRPGKAQREAMSELKAKLTEDFPGYSVAFSNDTPDLLAKLERAAADETLSRTPAGEALNTYLAARQIADESIDGWRKTKVGPQGARAREMRYQLRVLADDLGRDYPGFSNIFERVLENEMAVDD